MIYITQLIYLKEGKQDIFNQFEELAIPIIAKYNGQLLLRVRPEEHSYIQSSIDKPNEIHFISFPSEADFDNFKMDNERKSFLHLKEESIQSAILVQGIKLG